MKETIKEEELETVFEKGIGLEKEFCEYLKTDLGWEKARVRSQMASNINMRGTNVDVIAERLDDRGRKLDIISKLYGIICFLFIMYGIYLSIQGSEDANVFIYFGVFVEITAFVAYYLSSKLNKENAWVECKNLKNKATIKQMQTMIYEMNAYKESNNKEYKFVECYFVSKNGFVENALKLAMDNKIICYIKQNEKFKKIEYWDN